MIFKIQRSFDGLSVLIYNHTQTHQGQMTYEAMPEEVQEALPDPGGKVYWRGQMVGSKIRFIERVKAREW